ncbi:MAG: glucose-1-phosphate cytidylyltransferase [Methylococcaceae bacterium]
MKVVILAGGYGTRISEETASKPKPMIDIGGKPILWHIMKTYSHFGYNDFVICLGYKGYVIKEYFSNYFLHQSDVTLDLKTNKMEIHDNSSEPWKVTLVDTGLETMTGGRIKRVQKYVGNEPFMLTYGDGVSNINIPELVKCHQDKKKLITVSTLQDKSRFGVLDIDKEGMVKSFLEKPQGDGSWINIGFFVCEPQVFDYIKEGDKTVFEKTPLESLAKANELSSYKHQDFWKCMDTLRDKNQLDEMWFQGQPKWKVWG